LAQRTGYEVKIGDLRLAPPLHVVASAIVVSKSGEILLQGERVVVGLTPLDLFLKRIYHLTLERPVIKIKLENLVKPQEQLLPNLSIRTLKITDGALVLETGAAERLAIRSINFSARNLNLEGDIGVVIGAYIPWTDGDANVNIHGRGQVGEAHIQIQQRSAKTRTEVLQRKDQALGNLECHFELKKSADEGYEIAASGRLQEFKVGTEKITGEFTSNLDLDTKLTAINLFFRSRLSQLPSRIGGIQLPLLAGPITATVRGDYSVEKKVFTVHETEIVSPFASAEGKGEIAFSGKQATLNTALRVHEIHLDVLDLFLPKPVRRLGLSGMAAADVHLSGPFNSLAIKGVAQSQEAKIQGKKFQLSHLSVTAPFEFANSSFQAKGARIKAKGITWGPKGELQLQAGEMSFAGDMEKNLHGPFRSEGQFQIVQGHFSTPDGSKVGEHLTINGNFDLAKGAEQNRIPFKGKVEIAGLELLWGKFFGDFREERPVIEIGGAYIWDKDEVKLERMNLILRSVGAKELRGAIQRFSDEPTLNLDVTGHNLSPGGLYYFFIRDTFKKRYPVLGA
jgi:hypothetical protein